MYYMWLQRFNKAKPKTSHIIPESTPSVSAFRGVWRSHHRPIWQCIKSAFFGLLSYASFFRAWAQIYKLETPNEAPVLEIVVSLSTGSTAAPISTAVATAKATPLGGTGAPQAPSCPFVSVSSDGARVVVEHNPQAKGGDGGRGGVAGVRGRFTLSLPQKVVARTAMSFFWEGDLTIRAALAGIEQVP